LAPINTSEDGEAAVHFALIVIFLLVAIAPMWGRWKVKVWLKENMREERMISRPLEPAAKHRPSGALDIQSEI
jgi:hypothetical protein